MAVVLATVWCLPVAAHAATATQTYAPGDAFGRAGFSEGSPTADGIAVGQATGNIFIGEHNFSSVAIYAPGANNDTPLAEALFDSVPIAPFAVAVDPVNDAVYTDDYVYSGPAIGKALSDQAPTPTYTLDAGFAPPPGLITRPGALAVDPVTRDLLAADLDSNLVHRLDANTGASISSFDGSDSGQAFQAVGAVAVGPTGTIYVVDNNSRIERFDAAGNSLGAFALPAGAQVAGLAVQPTTGEVVAMISLGGQTYLQGYTSAGTQTFRAPTSGVVDFPGFGLAWDGGTDRIYASRGDGTAVTFLPGTEPGLDAPVVTSTDRNTADVEVTVDTGGVPTTLRLEYCVATSACSNYPTSNPSDPLNPWKRGPDHTGLTGSPETVGDELPLRSNTTYRLRAYAENSVVSNTSPVTTFSTPPLPPVVTTGDAGSVTRTEATLSGTIDTVGAQTTYYFEYGTSTSYGSRIPVSSDATAGNSFIPRAVSKDISGLQAGTEYHYRLVARNSAGTAFGADRTFTTAGDSDSPPARAYEQVTPVDKQGAQVNSDFHIQSAADGSAIAVSTASTPPGGTTAKIRQNFLSRRGATDWLNWLQVDAPQDSANVLVESSTLALSDDFDHALVVSNRKLDGDLGFSGGGNLYIKNLRTGSYTFIGGAPGTLAFELMAGGQTSETVYIAGAPDFSWILISPQATLQSPNLPANVPSTAVYRWDRQNGLALASVMDGGGPPPAKVQVQQVSPLHRTASADGTVLYFGVDNSGNNGPLYRREGNVTTLISHADGTTGIPASVALPATIDSVSRDGRYALFHTNFPIPLTSDPVNPNGGALYRYDSTNDHLDFIASVGGTQAVLSEDGQTVYFDRALPPNVPNAAMMWRDGVTHLVDPTGATEATMAPNGQFFAWVSPSDKTARLYDATADKSICVSCTIDGSKPGKARTRTDARSIGNQTPRTVTNDGKMFFDTPDRLVKADHNGKRDVYMYYRGRLTLISPGNEDADAQFVDASADGSDIFFQTEQGLVGQDKDGNTDVYDARVGGGFASQWPAEPPAPCVRTECGEAGTGPVASPTAPSSSTQPGKGTPKTNQQKVRVSVGKVKFTSKSVRITFQASQRGRVIVSGSRVRRTIRNVSKQGTYTITVPLSKKARALVRAHKKFKVSVKVSLYGGWGSASAKYSRTLGK